MPRRKKGFTLIELMVTVAILGLGMTIVFFQIDTLLPGTRLQAACARIASDLENMRLAAIMNYRLPVYFEYDLEFHGYRAYIPYEMDEERNILGPGESELLPFEPFPEGVVFSEILLGAKSHALEDSGRVTALIQPNGSITGHIVILKDIVHEREFSVRVASLTGFAEILDRRVNYEELDADHF